jgi:short subunit dehydrogenase-like uncharacterized protein
MPAPRDLDIVVFGATGFVGKLTAEYLAEHAPDGVRVGLAGRSAEKLEQVRSTLGPRAADWPLLTADSSDHVALKELAEATRVLATTVGPYKAYGLPVVEACAAAGTDYVDLTGEVLFMRAAIDRYDDAAKATGARIVHTCGFDSIPSDLGVLLLHEAAQADGAGTLQDTTLVVRAMKGGASGGTIASLKGQVDEMAADPAQRRVAEDPYGLSPDRSAEPELGDESDARGPSHDDALGEWVAPFVMGMVNTRVVRRSNALQDWAYGRELRYEETMSTGSGPVGRVKATGAAGGVVALQAGMGFGPVRAVLDRVLPSPGEGPGEDARRNGFFKIDVHTRTSGGARYVCHVSAQGDPGYAATAVMLGESALCLALDTGKLPERGGVLTPATAMGTALVDRLRAAGQTFAVERL